MNTVIKIFVSLVLLLIAIKLGVGLWHTLEPAHCDAWCEYNRPLP